MIGGVPFTFVILDLKYSRYSLLTEGNFIASATADYELGPQIELIRLDSISH